MAEDKLIKQGQLTLPRIASLAAIIGLIVGAVYLGGVWLTIGYCAITLAMCALLFLIAIDYGVEIETVALPEEPRHQERTEPASAGPATDSSAGPATERLRAIPKTQRRAGRPAKRRR